MLTDPVLLPPSADWPHEPTSDEWWQESIVLGWADPDNEMGGFIRLSHQPNRGVAKLCFGVVSRNGPGYTRTMQDLPIRPEDRAGKGFSVDGFCSATFDGQNSRWLAKDEHIDMEIDACDAPPVFDFFSVVDRTEVSKVMTPNHIQIGGTFTGRIRIGGKEYSLKGSTYRDHSWGVRLLHNPRGDFYAAWWLGGSFGPDFSFGFSDGRSQSGHAMPHGHIYKDGKLYKATIEDACVGTSCADGMSARSARVVAHCEELGRLTIEATGYGNVVLEMEKKHFELSMPCTVVCGERRGGGSVEVIFNPRNGTDRPFWLECAALDNGPNQFVDGKLVQRPFSRPE